MLWPQFEVAAVEPVVQMERWKRGEWSSTCCCSPAWSRAAAAHHRRWRMRLSNGRWREEEEDDDMWGPRVSDRREGLQCNIRIHIHLQLGPFCLHTYSVSFLRETKNCNGMFRNRRIVMVFLQTLKIVMVWIQKTLLNKPASIKLFS